MCNIVTEFYLYSIVYTYLINSRLDVTHSVRHHFRTVTLSDPAVTVLGLIMLNTCTSDIKNVNTVVIYSFLP